MIIALRRLERLDKDEYTEEERQEAQEQYEVRRQEALQAEVCCCWLWVLLTCTLPVERQKGITTSH